MIKEYLSRNDLKKLTEEMQASEDDEAQIEWGNFTKVDPEKTQGGVITGLNNKIAPLRSPNTMSILKTLTEEERARGVREISLSCLREPSTAIFIVLSERQASQYRILMELIFGLAAIEMEASTEKDATPVLMALDEAGNIKPPKLQERLKIGRYRNTPYLLGFQDVSQLRFHFQENGAKAVLAGIKNQIFLPGIDIETGIYASSLLGPTTVLSRTEVDAPGSKMDSERVSESRRDFKQAPELRRLVSYRQAIAVIGTADPILFRFPERGDTGDIAVAPRRLLSPPRNLAQAVAEMNEIKAERRRREAEMKNSAAAESNLHDASGETPTAESDTPPTPEPKPSGNRRVRVDQFANGVDQSELPFDGGDEEEPCAA